MTVFKIFYGATKPIRAVGQRQCKLLQFAEKYRGWHTIGKDKSDIRAMRALQSRGCLEVSGDQFRFIYPIGKG